MSIAGVPFSPLKANELEKRILKFYGAGEHLIYSSAVQ